MARNKKVEILSNDKEVLHPMTDGDCVIFEDGQTLAQKLSEDDSVKYTPKIVNSSPMFKVGEGNTVDYSDNVLGGAYERATLQGQTYVNYIQESSADEVTLPTPFTEYERTQHNTLTSDEEGTLGINLVGQSYVNALQHDSEEEYVVLGESLEFQEKKVEYTNEGQIKSAMLKGQTLVNLATTTNFSTTTGGSCQHFIGDRTIAPNTYTIIADITISGVGECMFAFYEYFGMTRSNTRLFTESGRYVWTENIINTKIGSYGFYASPGASTDTTYTLNNLVILEGDHTLEDIPYFEGMQSVTVSTRLENKLGTCTTTLSTNPKTGKTFTTNDSNTRSLYLANNSSQLGLKPNTKYIVGFKVSNLVLDGLSMVTLMLNVDSTNRLFEHPNGNGSTIYVDKNGVYRFVMKTTNTIESATALIKGIAEEWEKSGSYLRSMTISEIMYVEYQNGMENWNLPYFEDYQVMKPVQVESVNKNIFTTQTVLGTYDTTYTIHDVNSVTITGTNDTTAYKNIKFLINVKPNTDYKISCKHEKLSGETTTHCDVYSVPKNGEAKKYLGGTVINSGEYTQLDVRFYVNTTEASQNGTIRYYDIQMKEGSTTTEYVPHQSKTTYSWDEVILRKIGDVEDTLDLTTGEWVQRIGEIVLDGSEKWISSTAINSEGFKTYQICMDKEIYWMSGINQNSILKSDKLPTTKFDNGSEVGIFFDGWGLYMRLQASTREDFIAYLKSNPVKVQYVRKTPIVHKVNLSRPNLQVYDDITHVHTKCLDGTLIPNIYLPSDISYPAILEPGKKYNVCVNHTEVSADNPLKVNVGGTEIAMTDSRMTLTTPATLANSNVSFTGKGNKIKESMLVKNSSLLTRDLPHFNGIGSVQLGKTIENLCGSNAYMSGMAAANYTFGQNGVQFTITKAGSCVWVFPIIRPLDNGKKYFVYAPNTYPSASAAHVSFRHLYNNQLTFAYSDMVYPINKYTIFTINQDKNQFSHIVIGNHGGVPLNSQCTLTYPIICEYEPGMENWDWESIGYFTGTKNIGNEFMKISNSDATKHNGLYITKDQPIDLTWEQGAIFYESGVSWSQMTNNVNSMRIRTPQPLTLEPNKTYRVSLGSDKYQYGIQLYNGSNNGVFDYGWNTTDREFIFTTTKDKYKVGIAIGKIDSSNNTPITPSESVHAQVRLEEVTDVVLRSCSGKYDELDLTRGTYTQNVGRVYLDGINALSRLIAVVGDTYQPADTTLKTFDIRCDGAVVDSICLSNRFPMRESMTSTDINFESVRIHSTNQSCRLTISTKKASTLEEFKLWLQDNPLEIIYALKTPIIHKVHIGNKNEANTEVTKPNGVFTLPALYAEQTNIELTNNGIVPKVQSRDYIAYPVLPMINRTYTLQHNLTGGVSNLTVDLLGRTQAITYQNHKSLIYSPETMDAILHHELRISGKGKISRVMYIDGGYMDRDIPYIEGMKNAVNPIIKNYTDTQENICYVDCGEIRLTPDMFEQGSIYNVSAHVGLPYDDDKVDAPGRIRTKELIDLEPGEQYVFLGDPTYQYSMHFHNKDGIKVGVYPPYDLKWNGNIPFTISADLPKVAIFICKANQSNITPSELEGINVQLVKVSEIKQLRSLPHGVHDEIDLETGKYIQRVGEITFDGTESWIVGYSSWDNKRTYYNNSFVDIKVAKNSDGNANAYYDAVRCPQLHRSYMSRLASALIDGVCAYYYSGYQRIFISKQDCATVEELKLWLQENPITVQYELPKPIVKDIVIHNYPHSYEGGHVIIENGDLNTPIPAQLTYRAVTNRSGQIQQHTEQVEKQEKEINELETLILANIYLNQTR